jgi:hypothetical protein
VAGRWERCLCQPPSNVDRIIELLSADPRVVSCATLSADMEAGVASSPESRRDWSDRLDPLIGRRGTGWYERRQRMARGET